MERIVVGVDGSEASQHAVQWATDEAVLRKATLELVNVYPPVAPYKGLTDPAQVEAINLRREETGDVLRASRQAAEGLLAEVAAGITDVPVEQHAVEDASPSHALVEQAADASLLVVSARGLGPFRRLLLGSVSQQVVLHARCPVVVIRPTED